MFFIEEKLITEREVSNAEEVLQHIQWTSKMLNAGNKTDNTSMQETVNDSNPSSDDNSDDDQLNNVTLEEEFIDWCQEVPYMSPYSTAQQHMYQAFKVWSYITPKRNVQALLNRQSITAWVNRAWKKYEASTINSYLGSLVRLTTFLKDTGRITGEEESMEDRLQEHIKLIRMSLKKKIRVRRTVVESDEIQTMIIPEDIAAFLSSTPSNRCRELALKPPMKVVASDFYDVRDFIIMRILQTNAQRPMAIRGMTHRNISMAKRIDDGGALVTVASHKTAETGPVIISPNGEVYSMLKNFIAMLKRIPNFQHQDNQSIFVSYPKRDGSVVPMTSSHMNKAIQRLWNEGPSEKAISATRLRKATSTHVRAAVPESREVLARHMTHAAATADRYYALYDREQLAMPISSLISSVMENPNSKDIQHSIHWPKSGLPTPKPKDAIECGADKEGKNEEISDDQISKVDNIDNDVSDTTEDYDVENYFPPLSPLNECNLILSDSEELPEKQIKKHKRRSFTESESETLIAICQQNLKKGKVFRSDIKEIVEKDPRGQKLIANLKARNSGNDTDIWKIIVDRIHAERRRRLRINKS
ncbi:unnamed protein product [Mytilus coruscus]|uniref:Tyr recombinase domain-containing protein n=1 Tax=Mytilus coruscus TaxID=42192 RepID=A0A6J8B7M9_MYTCO|nr:unnamed protein product [Mytilus coruscus]